MGGQGRVKGPLKHSQDCGEFSKRPSSQFSRQGAWTNDTEWCTTQNNFQM